MATGHQRSLNLWIHTVMPTWYKIKIICNQLSLKWLNIARVRWIITNTQSILVTPIIFNGTKLLLSSTWYPPQHKPCTLTNTSTVTILHLKQVHPHTMTTTTTLGGNTNQYPCTIWEAKYQPLMMATDRVVIRVSDKVLWHTKWHRRVICGPVFSARNKDQKLVGCFLKIGYFYRLLTQRCPIEFIWEIWPTKMDFGRSNAEIGQKMANGRLLFLALVLW